MPQYKLTYFNGRGRGEVIRLIFAHAAVEYEDVRYDWPHGWAQHKATAPNGQIPLLEIDGTVFCQSNAICRFLAKQYGLHGKTPAEGFRIDMIVDTIDDMVKPLIAAFQMQDEAKKADAMKKFEEEQFPESLQRLEKLLIANNGGDGYFVGDELSWADLMFLNWGVFPANDLVKLKVDLSKVPKLEALKKRVESIPRIAAWLEKRPDTIF